MRLARRTKEWIKPSEDIHVKLQPGRMQKEQSFGNRYSEKAAGSIMTHLIGIQR